MGKNRKQITENVLDPKTEAYLNQYRQRAGAAADDPNLGPGRFAQNLGFAGQTGLGDIGAYQNPYESQVVAGVQGDYDRQRQQAAQMAASEATKAGAFGGSRAAVLKANMLNDVNRNESSQLAGIRSQGFNDAANRLLQERMRQANLGFGGLNYSQNALGALTPGLMQGSGSGQTTQMPYNDFTSALGLGVQGLGMLAPGGFFGKAALAR